jgi:hypothetical protein
MSMFRITGLPIDVTGDIFRRWVHVKDVGRLDSALCVRSLRAPLAAAIATIISKLSLKVLSKTVGDSLVESVAIAFNGEHVTEIAEPETSFCGRWVSRKGRVNRWLVHFVGRHPLQQTLQRSQKWFINVKEVEIDSVSCARRMTVDWYDTLRTICRACTKLTTLTVRHHYVSYKELAKALRSATRLSHLSVHICNDIPCTVPAGVALPTLQSFKTSYDLVSDSLMLVFGQKCPRLVVLHVFQTSTITDVGVRAVLQGCPLLRDTDVEYAAGVSPELRVELVKLRRLAELVAGNDWGPWQDVNAALLVEIMKASPELRKLYLFNHEITDEMMDVCERHCPLLEHIDLRTIGSLLTSAAMQSLISSLGGRLRCVRLSLCPQLDSRVVLALAAHCPLLEEYLGPLTVSDAAVVKLAQRCTQLRVVDLNHTAVGDDAVIALSIHCKNLVTLHLWDCNRLTMRTAHHLMSERSPKLTWVSLPEALGGRSPYIKIRYRF